MKKAFTLAEVLITLGIIGIVAALTLPALIANYQKKVIGVRMKKFYAVWMQALRMMSAENGFDDSLTCNVSGSNNNPDVMLESYNRNWGRYLKNVKMTKTGKGIVGTMPDNSAFYIRKTHNSLNCCGTCDTYLTFCVDSKVCQNIDESGAYLPSSDGKTTFNWLTTGPSLSLTTSRESYLESCRTNGGGACATLIMLDGWEIKDDYPW